MNRFHRLVTLRRLREEAQGTKYLQARAKVDEWIRHIDQLEEENRLADEMTRQAFTLSKFRLAPDLHINFARGQVERKKQMHRKLEEARIKLEEARKAWQVAHREIQQVERMEAREERRLREEAERRLLRQMDEVAVLRHTR